MQVEDLLREQKQAVENELSRLLNRRDSLLFRAMKHAVLSGGKRYRPLLLLSAGDCLGADRVVLLPFACAVELIHNYSLVHDDLPAMDDDDFRRGRPSCHKAFGEDLAILAGDGLLTLAFEVMASAALPAELSGLRERVMEEVSLRAGPEGMIDGQALDIRMKPEEVSEKSLQELILKKTGGLIMASVKAGAILGQASPERMAALEEYGWNVGFAFQIRDDLRDAGQGHGRKADFRPNFVSALGEDEARRRLQRHIEQGIAALDKVSLRSEALNQLALKLRDLDEG